MNSGSSADASPVETIGEARSPRSNRPFELRSVLLMSDADSSGCVGWTARDGRLDSRPLRRRNAEVAL